MQVTNLTMCNYNLKFDLFQNASQVKKVFAITTACCLIKIAKILGRLY